MGIFHEVERIARSIPNDELSIQWDCTHPAQYELGSAEERRAIDDLLLRLGNAVPANVELGYHLCYGDFEHRHARQPIDTAAMVAMATVLASRLQRPIGWIHMPVPRDRSDDAYFTPLHHLDLHGGTRLYLGLVHSTDGVDGSRRRMAAASKAVADFGIATECGVGRRPPSQHSRAAPYPCRACGRCVAA